MRRKIICVVILILFCIIVIPISISAKVNIQKKEELKKYYEEMEQLQENESRMVAVLEDEGWDMEQTCIERLIPLNLADENGNSLTFWNYICTRPELRDGPPSIYNEVFNPELAESSRSVLIDDNSSLSGTIYQKDGRSYLLWTPTDINTLILLIDYDPNTIVESEIIKMAVSCH